MDNAQLDEFIERVRERSDIYSVVSRYVTLTLKGNKYWACCPFHGEKTASFTITPEKGLFYCFGCHEGGNVFNFISKIEHISYFDAVKLQAERLGMSLPYKNKSKAESDKDREIKILYKINEQLRDYYHEYLLKTAEGNTGRKYFNARGITAETIERFKLGYAPGGWDRVFQEFLKRGFTKEQLLSAGVVSKGKNNKYYDRMRGRVIIPITDTFGKVVGFGGRILNNTQKDIPKYLNTAETAIFNKGKLLFGLDNANKAIFSKKYAVVVEGYMDTISLVSAGYENVVATLGTAFTEEQAKLLSRYARKILFCYDSDEAGQRATMRALPIIEKVGADVSVITIPNGKDPDEFIQKYGKEKFSQLIKNALPIFDYRLQYILKHNEISTITEKINALRKILPAVVNVEDTAKRGEYCKKISDELFIDEDIVFEELKKYSSVEDNSESVEDTRTLSQKASDIIFRMAWNECDILDYVLALLPIESFSKVHREIIAYLEKCKAEEIRPTDITAAKFLSKEANSEISRILLAGAGDPRSMEVVAFSDSVQTLKKIWLRKNYNSELKDSGNYISDNVPVYNEKLQEVLNIKQKLEGS